MRQFDGGATRDNAEGKLDYEGFISPLVLLRYAEYMDKNRHTADGLRGSDNWQDGIPTKVYMSSLWRHFMDLWLHHRNRGDKARESLEDAICGILFNTMGYLYQILSGKEEAPRPQSALPVKLTTPGELLEYQLSFYAVPGRRRDATL